MAQGCSVTPPALASVVSGYCSAASGTGEASSPSRNASTSICRMAFGSVAESRITEPPRAAWKRSSSTSSRRM